ncbi:MAG TPA: hypothetical protein VFT84_14050, partial [Gemmatimonadales bacterium]|nr:hypothetical protein [Gemmatimonadales bacterium]
GAGLTAAGLAAAWMLASYARLDQATALGLTLVTIGCGLAAVVNGALRSAGRSARLRWLAAGIGVGLLLAVLR